ncbi:MAG: hypothetical protein WAW52_11655 [Methanothrix sp.]
MDLPALLAAGDKENFKYFYLFFRREALPQLVDGDCFLDRVLEGSVAYAQEIGEDLKENVYRAMKILAQGFLGWLEGYLSAKVEDLTPKTKLQSYYEHDYEGLMAVLKKNGKKLQVDPARREPEPRAEFEGSMGKLGPLRERILKTDELIDEGPAVRAHGRGDCDRRGQRDLQIAVRATDISSFTHQSNVNHQVSKPARREGQPGSTRAFHRARNPTRSSRKKGLEQHPI